MRALLVALAIPDPASLRAALQAALGATSVDLCQAPEAAITWLENRPCDLVAVAGDEASVVDVVSRLRRVSRTLPLLALVPDAASRAAGAAWLAGADEVAGMSALVAGMALEGLDEVRHPERDALRRLQRLWHAGPADALRQALASRLAARFRDVGLTTEGLVGLTTQDVESPQSAALVVNATADADALVLGVRRVKRTYPGLAVVVLADPPLHDAFRRAGADECLAAGADPDAVLHAVARAQAACRAALDLDVLRGRETRLRALLEHLPEAVMLVSPEHAVLAVNLAALRLIGAQDARQVLGSPLAPWLELGEDQLDGAVQLLDGVASGATRELFTRTRHLADPRRLLLRAVPFQRESGGPPAALIVLREATDTPAIDHVAPAPVTSPEGEAEREAWQAERLAWDTERLSWEAAREAWDEERASLLARLDALSGELAAVATLRTQLEAAQVALGEADVRHEAAADAQGRLARVEALGVDLDSVPSLVEAAARLAVLEQQEVPALLARAQAQQQAHEDQLARLRDVIAGHDDLRAERDAALEAAHAATTRLQELEARLADAAAVPTAPSQADEPPPHEVAPAAAVHRWMLEDIARVGIARTNAEGRIIETNDQAARLCGFPDAAALLAARHLPTELTALAEGDESATVRFETCLQVDGATPQWVAGARLAAVDGADDVTWLLAEVTSTSGTTALPDTSTLLEALADECVAIVEDPPLVTRGPRALDAEPIAEGAGATALARARVLLAQLSACRRRRRAAVQVDDLATHLVALDPLLARLATDDVAWTAVYPQAPLHVPVAPADVERCLTSAVAAMREALPLGGRLSLRVEPCHRSDAGEPQDGHPMLRPCVEFRLDAQGYGARTPALAPGLRDLAARIGGVLDMHEGQALSVHLRLTVPRAVVIARAA